MAVEHKFSGKWICAPMTIEDRFAPVFKKEFIIDKVVGRAEAFVSGLGLFELRINGELADDTLLNPAHTQYSQTVLYRVFDVKNLLKEGKNEITIEVGHSFYNETVATWKWQLAQWRDVPKVLCDIEINFTDGTCENIITDSDWQVCTDGVITANSIYYGEAHDYRNKAQNWQSSLLAKAPNGKLQMQKMEPMRRINTFAPAEIADIGNNSYVVKSPEMVTGWAKIILPLKEGQTITVTYGERLLPDGSVVHIGKGIGRDGNWFPLDFIQHDTFIGDGVVTDFEPKFSYKGFRYIQIDNCQCELKSENIVIYRIANDVDNIAEFTCSEPLINDLHSLMCRSILNNLQGKPTDTPVWEKNGWLGDLSCGLLSMVYNFNMGEFLQSFTTTMADCHNEYGMLPPFVPIVDANSNHPVWNTVFVFTAKALLDYYGQVDYIKSIYPILRDYALKQIEEIKSRGWVWDYKTLSDWVAPIGGIATDEANPNSSEGAEICATTFIYKMLSDMTEIAEEIGEDGSDYTGASQQILKAFNEKFYDTEEGCYKTTFWEQIGGRGRYRQTSNLLPLAFDMVPELERGRVLKSLVDDIKSKGNHLDTGCTGTRFVLPVLFDNGEDELAYKVLTQTTYPSWGYWLTKGDDSAWESWEDTTRSLDHYFLGSYEEALYTHLAGIKNVKMGFSEFTFEPHFNCGLQSLSVKLKTSKGKIECRWELCENICKIQLIVPVGITVYSELNLKNVSASNTEICFEAEICL